MSYRSLATDRFHACRIRSAPHPETHFTDFSQYNGQRLSVSVRSNTRNRLILAVVRYRVFFFWPLFKPGDVFYKLL